MLKQLAVAKNIDGLLKVFDEINQLNDKSLSNLLTHSVHDYSEFKRLQKNVISGYKISSFGASKSIYDEKNYPSIVAKIKQDLTLIINERANNRQVHLICGGLGWKYSAMRAILDACTQLKQEGVNIKTHGCTISDFTLEQIGETTETTQGLEDEVYMFNEFSYRQSATKSGDDFYTMPPGIGTMFELFDSMVTYQLGSLVNIKVDLLNEISTQNRKFYMSQINFANEEIELFLNKCRENKTVTFPKPEDIIFMNSLVGQSVEDTSSCNII